MISVLAGMQWKWDFYERTQSVDSQTVHVERIKFTLSFWSASVA